MANDYMYISYTLQHLISLIKKKNKWSKTQFKKIGILQILMSMLKTPGLDLLHGVINYTHFYLRENCKFSTNL